MNVKLTDLHKLCLADMPMIIDIIAGTLNRMDDILNVCHENYCTFLNNHFIPRSKAKYSVVPCNEDFQCFNDLPLEKSLLIAYAIELRENKMRNPRIFTIEIVYNLDHREHVVYFSIEDHSKEIDLSGLISDLQSTDEYMYGIEPTRLYVEISVDETLNDEKIYKCSELFKDKILYPIINTLK